MNLVVIDTQRQRLTPPDFLTAKEREIFGSIVDNCARNTSGNLNCRFFVVT